MHSRSLLATQVVGINAISLSTGGPLGGCPNVKYVGIYTDQGEKVGSLKFKDINNFKPLPRVVYLQFVDTDSRVNYIGGNISWTLPCKDVDRIEWYSVWLTLDKFGTRRVRLIGNVSAFALQLVVYDVYTVGDTGTPAKYIIVYSGNTGGEMYLGESIPLVDLQTRRMSNIMARPRYNISQAPPRVLTGEPIQVVGGFLYEETPAIETAPGGFLLAKYRWSFYYSVVWNTATANPSYYVYMASQADMNAKTFLVKSNSSNTVAISAGSRLRADRPYIGVYSDEAATTLVGTALFGDVKNFPKLPKVSRITLRDKDLRAGWLGGNITWRAPSVNLHLVTSYSIWLSEDQLGFNRVKNVIRGIIVGQTSYVLPALGVQKGRANYLLVFTNNRAGEQAIAAYAEIFDVDAGSGICPVATHSLDVTQGFAVASSETSLDKTMVFSLIIFWSRTLPSVNFTQQSTYKLYSMKLEDTTYPSRFTFLQEVAASSPPMLELLEGALPNGDTHIAVYTSSGLKIGLTKFEARGTLAASGINATDVDGNFDEVRYNISWVPSSPTLVGFHSYAVWFTRDVEGWDRALKLCEVPANTTWCQYNGGLNGRLDYRFIAVYLKMDGKYSHASTTPVLDVSFSVPCSFTADAVINAFTGGALRVAVGQTFSFEIENSPFDLTYSSPYIVPYDAECGTAASPSIVKSCRKLDNCPGGDVEVFRGFPDAPREGRNFRWSGIVARKTGKYRVCVKLTSFGSFTVISVGKLKLYGLEPYTYVGIRNKFDLEIFGSSLTLDDQITIVPKDKLCGENGTGTQTLNVVFSEGPVATEGGIRYNNVIGYDESWVRVCWCGGSGCQHGQSGAAFSVSMVYSILRELSAISETSPVRQIAMIASPCSAPGTLLRESRLTSEQICQVLSMVTNSYSRPVVGRIH
jgi:hypothetical protein